MDLKKILTTINTDLVTNAASRVIYLEGQSDPAIFFGLLGVTRPAGGVFIHQQTLVKGFSASDGSGNKTVRAFVEAAQSNGYGGRVFGIVDGDGDGLKVLAPQFDSPHVGPLFAWKAYSIECLLAHLSWPPGAGWGTAPDWQTELMDYTPYVAINQLRRVMEERLSTLRLMKFWHPIQGQPLETTVNVQAALDTDRGLISGLDVAVEFGNEVDRFRDALTDSLEHGLVFLNGKWLLRHFLVTRLGENPDHWCEAWVRHAQSAGGLEVVRELWQRITGSPP